MVGFKHGLPPIGTTAQRVEPISDFDFMFPELLADPHNLLPEDASTIEVLKTVGASMVAATSNTTGPIAAVYTYFGQFIDHDITATIAQNNPDAITLPDFKPLTRNEIKADVRNGRSAHLDLDSLYGHPAPRDVHGRMILGTVSAAPFGSIPVSDPGHDLPRRPLNPNPQTPEEIKRDREALLGDERNDENLLIAQLHLTFLRAHNALMDCKMEKAAATRALRRRYQLAVLHDFLPTVCDPTVVTGIINNGPGSHRAINDPTCLFMPLEFAQAAYRFGHSMVRQEYFHNRTFDPAPFNLLFTFTALSGDLSPSNGPNTTFETLPDNWIIEWDRFLPGESLKNPARRIDTLLAPELDKLRDHQGNVVPGFMSKLATRNLLRGYRFRLPTGQAIAHALGTTPLEGQALKDVLPAPVASALEEAGMLGRTPLWLYVLAEAGAPTPGPDGAHLGYVGSTIVAETIWNLIRHSEDSVIFDPPCEEEIPPEERTIAGIVRMGVDVPV